ncbi:MAG: extracellular solute-binding protein [Mesorhizobium sp.]|uniref:extracellular solute-binding protein n=1 Tax=Mesorhizobium sp. TaxID=1871066 RepID=UPI000FE65F1A|nr:extracellular solute-binding protein [Mesorhizobium sp.]RWP52146.1 MAG: extracellular solute-binding protein [Mesorhizobium sp.]RWP83304.1 MAG: extracellular solute-binding protein [Mesorhizobium sp.]RWQ41188.1 MAG: extracellular solute-binding protein [Mesorhizobium sp.]TIL27887.1 MAG: extracellular solute-binding protein [Mesorhizobium sp.]
MFKNPRVTSLVVASALGLAFSVSAHAEGKLSIYAWADSIAPDVVAKFEKETGIDVTVDAFSSNEDLLTKLQAGSSGYDIVTPSQHFVKIMIDSGLLEDIGASSMAAYQQILPEWQKPWWDPTGNHSIPLAFGNAGYTVNRDVYKGPVDSWKTYFEPPVELRGKIASLAQPDEVVSAAQNYLGIKYCSEDPQEMKRVLDLLQAQKPYVAAYSSDNIENRIGGGEVGAHFWWDGNTMRVRRNDKANVEYAMPKEGLVGWLDSYVVPKGAANIDNAKKFIDFMAEVDNATDEYNYYGHSSPVKIDETKALYSKENAPELFPTVPVKMGEACSPAAQELVTKVWTQLLQ